MLAGWCCHQVATSCDRKKCGEIKDIKPGGHTGQHCEQWTEVSYTQCTRELIQLHPYYRHTNSHTRVHCATVDDRTVRTLRRWLMCGDVKKERYLMKEHAWPPHTLNIFSSSIYIRKIVIVMGWGTCQLSLTPLLTSHHHPQVLPTWPDLVRAGLCSVVDRRCWLVGLSRRSNS